MLKNYFITAFRSLGRRKWISLFNILGLAIGMAAGLLSYLHIRYELSYDNFHSKSEQIHRIIVGDIKTGEGWVGISAPIPPKLKADIPEIEEVVRLTKLARNGKVVVSYDQNFYNEEHFFLADSSLFNVFDFKLLKGQKEQVFNTLDGIVISQRAARKLFGDVNPLGKIITVNDKFQFSVTGLMEDIPANSHIDMDYVVSFKNLEKMVSGTSLTGNWGQYNYYAYALLQPQADKSAVEGKIQSISIPLKDYTHSLERIGLQPIADIHFQHNRGNLKPSYNFNYIYIYAAAALGLILISLVNFINLKTAGSSKRVREVGVRKVMGASRPQLMGQFISETFLMSLFALILAIVLVNQFLLPQVNALFSVEMKFPIFQPLYLGIALVFTFIISILAGGYIAFFVTSFSPARAIKSQVKVSSRKSVFRSSLLGAQFLVSIILIASSILISRQLYYISDKNLGLNPDQIINIPLYNRPDSDKSQSLKSELGNISGIQAVSLNSFRPGQANWNQTVWWEGQEEDESMFIISVDPDFFETLNLELSEGDPEFIKNSITDRYAYVLNESARNHIGWESAQGKRISPIGKDGIQPVTGVVKDFHFQSLHNEVKPCVLLVGHRTPSQLYVKVSPTQVSPAILSIKEKLGQILPELPLEYSFLDTDFAQLYLEEQRAKKVINFYTLISILLALFGLYGLLTFEVNERTKELAIRKILGGMAFQLSSLLSKSFLFILLIAGTIGIPISWLLMNNWLSNFNYRVPIHPLLIFSPVLLLSLMIFAIIFAKIWRISRDNPVEALRYE